jgi:hypothetical protein
MAYGDDSKKKLADESEDYSYDYVEGDDDGMRVIIINERLGV